MVTETTRKGSVCAGIGLLLLTSGLAGLLPAADAASVPIDLRTWSQQGVPANGDWNVAATGSSVFQTINGDPTFFVSPSDLSDTLVRGRFKVETTSDDDMIGFVFGYRKPVASNGDRADDYDMYVLDWKQAAQTHQGFSASEGFALYHLRGVVSGQFTTFNGGSPIGHCFWAKDAARCPAQLTVLGTDYGTGKGWRDNTEYEFELQFEADHIRVWVKGGTGAYKDGKVIFDVAGSFQSGRFGFYNFSQASVRYSGFTVNEVPRAVIAPVPPAECSNGGATIGLDGSASSDPDGDPLTFAWSSPGITFDDPASPTPSAFFPLGTTTVTLRVSDGAASDTAVADVIVQDTLPPSVQLTRPRAGALYVLDQEVEHGLTEVPVAGLAVPIVAVGGITVTAEAADQCGLGEVRFTTEGEPDAVDDTPPFAHHIAPMLVNVKLPRTATATATDVVGQAASDAVAFWHVGTAPVA